MQTQASGANPPKILIADDQPDILESLRLLLKREGYSIQTARSPADALEIVHHSDLDVVLIDLNYARDTTSGQEGLELLSRFQMLDNTLPVVVMTAWGSVELAVDAMRNGARDFIQKPWDNQRLVSILRTQVELCRALRQGRRLEAENQLLRSQGSATMIADSRAMQPVLDLMRRVGPSDANVLITGEHGTGKDVLARTLHSLSERAGQPLITVNLGGLTESLFISELLGHVKGAFTDASSNRVGRFELADGGTLFLDEIANIPLAQQANLLRVLETGELERVGSSKTIQVDVRIVSATNADLQAEVEAGRFRADLLFRLNTVEIHLPPLRDREDDIPRLAMHFLGRYSTKYRKSVSSLDEAAMRALRGHSWPGNVRELEHAMERAVLLSADETVHAPDLGLSQETDPTGGGDPLNLHQAEAHLIRTALQRFQGNVTSAAQALGVSRSALYRRMEKHGL